MQRTLLLLGHFFLSLILLQAQKPVQALYETRYSDTQPWEIHAVRLYTYTAADSLETMQQNTLNQLNGILEPNFRETSAFDAQNRKTSRTVLYMHAPDWENYYRTLYTYNSEGLLSSTLRQNSHAGIWVDGGRQDHEYDLNQRKVSTRFYSINDSGNWKQSSAEFFTYDAAGNPIKRFETFTDTLGNIIDSSIRESYTYTLFNKVQTRLIEFKNSGSWEVREKYEYSYTLGGMPNTVWKQADLNNDLMLDDEYTLQYTYNADGSLHQETWIRGEESPVGGEQRFTYFYTLSNEETAPEKALTIYPNPAAELLQIDGITGNATLLLSDLYGRTFQAPLQNGRADISALAAGIYIVRIQQKEQTSNGGKLIIAR